MKTTYQFEPMEKFSINDLVLELDPEVITNPLSQMSVMCSPLAVALYDYIIGCQVIGTDCREALNEFRNRFPDEYMILLD
jgi:hypothetical protein